MASQSKFAGNVINYGPLSSFSPSRSFVNTSNATNSPNGVFSPVDLPAQSGSSALLASNFGFSIPSTGVIDAVIFKLYHHSSGNPANIYDFGHGFDLNNPVHATQIDEEIPTSASGSDTYSLSRIFLNPSGWTPANFNSSGFYTFSSYHNPAASGYSAAYVDAVNVTIHYH
jgi:hypothetical protein